jgi:hypothetical protein
MANDLTGQNIQNTYQRVLHVGDDGFMYDGTGSLYTPVSASHEITTETSSSHAISADTLGGLDTTVEELNYLDGITANNALHVKGMNQSAASTTKPTFTGVILSGTGLIGPKINLPTGAGPSNPHLAVRSELTPPSLYLGDRDGDIITFVAQDGGIAAKIDQEGGFSGIVNGGTF